jgi:hypothetical protein
MSNLKNAEKQELKKEEKAEKKADKQDELKSGSEDSSTTPGEEYKSVPMELLIEAIDEADNTFANIGGTTQDWIEQALFTALQKRNIYLLTK